MMRIVQLLRNVHIPQPMARAASSDYIEQLCRPMELVGDQTQINLPSDAFPKIKDHKIDKDLCDMEESAILTKTTGRDSVRFEESFHYQCLMNCMTIN